MAAVIGIRLVHCVTSFHSQMICVQLLRRAHAVITLRAVGGLRVVELELAGAERGLDGRAEIGPGVEGRARVGGGEHGEAAVAETAEAELKRRDRRRAEVEPTGPGRAGAELAIWTSTAPRSTCWPERRGNPRWSVARKLATTSLPASMAGEPAKGGMVCVGPP